MKEFFFKFLGWIGVLVFLLFGFLYYVFTFSVLLFFVTLLAMLVCAPPSRQFIIDRTGLNLYGRGMATAFVALFIAQAWVGISENVEVFEQAQVRKERDAVQALAKALAGERARFLAAKPAIVADIAARRDQGMLTEALALIDKHAARTPDPDLDKLRLSIRIAETEAGLKDEAAVPLRQRLALYKLLATLDPSSTRYAGRVAVLDAELKETSAREQAETGRVSAAKGRDAMLARQFDKRGGAHLKLQAELKRTMMNPASYAHVETTFLDTGKGMSVWTTFRGKNAAGETAENSVAATVDDSGNVLTIED
ncbi:hypothetical protein RBA41_22555 [Massilia sp. CCM 9210]|uniref:hypothetical protein n=1 Tax=Massilia scottii TaxID=3057166 RepID=UPI002796E0FF|nr:hypothetical protein [Massilia sp. CCM 9210]MDQ1816082.1 hypothetical protein [Massilia sp. CCM 9210]